MGEICHVQIKFACKFLKSVEKMSSESGLGETQKEDGNDDADLCTTHAIRCDSGYAPAENTASTENESVTEEKSLSSSVTQHSRIEEVERPATGNEDMLSTKQQAMPLKRVNIRKSITHADTAVVNANVKQQALKYDCEWWACMAIFSTAFAFAVLSLLFPSLAADVYYDQYLRDRRPLLNGAHFDQMSLFQHRGVARNDSGADRCGFYNSVQETDELVNHLRENRCTCSPLVRTSFSRNKQVLPNCIWILAPERESVKSKFLERHLFSDDATKKSSETVFALVNPTIGTDIPQVVDAKSYNVMMAKLSKVLLFTKVAAVVNNSETHYLALPESLSVKYQTPVSINGKSSLCMADTLEIFDEKLRACVYICLHLLQGNSYQDLDIKDSYKINS